MSAFRIQRLTLGVGVDKAIRAPFPASTVTVCNSTPDVLYVKSNPDDTSQRIGIEVGFERPFALGRTGFTDSNDNLGPCFWLNAVQGGEAVLIWS